MTDAIKRAEEKARELVRDFTCWPDDIDNQPKLDGVIAAALIDARNEGWNSAMEKIATDEEQGWHPRVPYEIKARIARIRALKVKP